MMKKYDNDNVLVLSEQVKQTGNIIFARGTTAIKNIRASSRKKLSASNIKFLQSLGFEISEMVS